VEVKPIVTGSNLGGPVAQYLLAILALLLTQLDLEDQWYLLHQ